MSGAADLEAHAEALILLAEDCADIPPPLLDEAAKRWARENKWMPKASELRELARETRSGQIRGTDYANERLQQHCDEANAYAWVQASGDPYVVGSIGGVRQVMRRSNVPKRAA